MTIGLTPTQKTPSAITSYYFGDEHALRTLDLKLIAGRNFSPSEIVDRDANSFPPVSGFIITRALARKLFPAGDALGKALYIENASLPTPIIGIVERLQGPFVNSSGYFVDFAENSVIAPYRMLGGYSTFAAKSTKYV